MSRLFVTSVLFWMMQTSCFSESTFPRYFELEGLKSFQNRKPHPFYHQRMEDLEKRLKNREEKKRERQRILDFLKNPFKDLDSLDNDNQTPKRFKKIDPNHVTTVRCKLLTLIQEELPKDFYFEIMRKPFYLRNNTPPLETDRSEKEKKPPFFRAFSYKYKTPTFNRRNQKQSPLSVTKKPSGDVG